MLQLSVDGSDGLEATATLGQHMPTLRRWNQLCHALEPALPWMLHRRMWILWSTGAMDCSWLMHASSVYRGVPPPPQQTVAGNMDCNGCSSANRIVAMPGDMLESGCQLTVK